MIFEMAVPLDYSTISEQAQGMTFYNDKLLLVSFIWDTSVKDCFL